MTDGDSGLITEPSGLVGLNGEPLSTPATTDERLTAIEQALIFLFQTKLDAPVGKELEDGAKLAKDGEMRGFDSKVWQSMASLAIAVHYLAGVVKRHEDKLERLFRRLRGGKNRPAMPDPELDPSDGS